MRKTIRPVVEDPVLVALYQGSLGPHPSPFKSFLEALKERLGLAAACLDIGIGEDGLEPIWVSYPSESDENSLALYTLHLQLWKSYPRKPFVKPGDVYSLDEIISAKQFADNAYAKALLIPVGVKNEIVSAVSGPDGVTCLLRLGIPQYGFDESYLVFARQLRLHLERALQLHMWIRRPASIVQMLTTMTNVLDIGLMLFNGHRTVIFTNDVARRQLQQESDFLLVDDKLVFCRPARYNKLFSEFFTVALNWRNHELQRMLAPKDWINEYDAEVPKALLRIDHNDGTYVDLLAQPIRTYIPYRNEMSPHFVVYMVDSRRHLVISEKLLMQMHGLKQTEARLAMMLANGVSIANAGKALGLTEGSARTYSKRIYSKLGVRRQAELVQAINASVLPLAEP